MEPGPITGRGLYWLTADEDITMPPGDAQVLSHYRLVRQLGAGGMGEVYLAQDLTLGRQVAIKLLPADRHGSDAARRRLLREAQAAAALDHPNICAVHEVASEGGRSFIVMQFVDGETLDARMQRGPIPLDDTLEIVGQVADALAYAHAQGVVHRDVKPQNIMIGHDGRVKVLDFGLAKFAPRSASDHTPTETQLTAQGAPLGTAAYMAPEQVRGDAVDGRADLFSLGVVLYECLAGKRPFAGRSTFEVLEAIVHAQPPSPAAVNARVPVPLSDLCLRLLAKAPHDRVQSADELRGSLRTIRDGSAPVLSGPNGPSPGEQHVGQRRRVVVAAVLVFAALALSLAAWATWWRSLALPPADPAAVRWYEEGLQALRAGAYQHAARALEQAVQVDESFVLAWARLAEAQAELDDLRSAPQSLSRVWHLVPDRSRLPVSERLQLEAIAAMVSRRGDDAVGRYEDLIARAPRQPYLHVDLGRAWEVVPDFTRAEAAYAAAVAIDGQSAPAHLRRAMLLAQRGAFDEALAGFDEAERLFQASSDLEGQTEVLLERSHLFLRREALAESHEQLARALAIASAASLEHQHVRAELQIGRVLIKQARFDEAERQLRDAAARAGAFEALQAQALVDLGNLFASQSRLTDAERHYRDAVALAGRFGARRTEARARLSLAVALVNQGRVSEGQALAAEALDYYTANHYRRERLQALQVLSRAADVTGDLDAADRAWRELLATGEASADRALVADALDGLGYSRLRRGELPAALDFTDRVLAEYERQGNELAATYARLRRADLLTRLGRHDEAAAQLASLRRAGTATAGGDPLQSFVAGVEARLALSRGRHDEASSAACSRAVETEDPAWNVDMRSLCATARSRAGRHAEAERAVRASLDVARTLEDKVTRAQALATGAEVAARAGDLETALARGVEAAGVLGPLQAHEALWRLQSTLAEAAGRGGRAEQSERLSIEARDAFDAIKRAWPADALEAYLATDAARAARRGTTVFATSG